MIQPQLPLKDMQVFTYDQLIQEVESEMVEFKKYSFPFTEFNIKTIQRTIVSFLNNQGGRIYFGINDERQVKGIGLAEKDKDLFSNFLLNLAKPIYPTCRCSHLKVIPYPVQSNNPKYELYDRYVVKLIVKQGESGSLYSVSQELYLSYTRLGSQNIKLNSQEIEKEIRVRAQKHLRKTVEEQEYNDIEPLCSNNRNRRGDYLHRNQAGKMNKDGIVDINNGEFYRNTAIPSFEANSRSNNESNYWEDIYKDHFPVDETEKNKPKDKKSIVDIESKKNKEAEAVVEAVVEAEKKNKTTAYQEGRADLSTEVINLNSSSLIEDGKKKAKKSYHKKSTLNTSKDDTNQSLCVLDKETLYAMGIIEGSSAEDQAFQSTVNQKGSTQAEANKTYRVNCSVDLQSLDQDSGEILSPTRGAKGKYTYNKKRVSDMKANLISPIDEVGIVSNKKSKGREGNGEEAKESTMKGVVSYNDELLSKKTQEKNKLNSIFTEMQNIKMKGNAEHKSKKKNKSRGEQILEHNNDIDRNYSNSGNSNSGIHIGRNSNDNDNQTQKQIKSQRERNKSPQLNIDEKPIKYNKPMLNLVTTDNNAKESFKGKDTGKSQLLSEMETKNKQVFLGKKKKPSLINEEVKQVKPVKDTSPLKKASLDKSLDLSFSDEEIDNGVNISSNLDELLKDLDQKQGLPSAVQKQQQTKQKKACNTEVDTTKNSINQILPTSKPISSTSNTNTYNTRSKAKETIGYINLIDSNIEEVQFIPVKQNKPNAKGSKGSKGVYQSTIEKFLTLHQDELKCETQEINRRSSKENQESRRDRRTKERGEEEESLSKQRTRHAIRKSSVF
eukprot:CAMPEP_0170529312 /NCGR_PEP_ID=MMETSP0209-20121228/20613_1 /TAXON_ID=665100 ORGANISM="Litonotus pictus, Strain P1" /NCGR_SAMPLE_ID=MMETSP0209 /ASSEMBLY_ACC=CAM_ASM_000301 /LENGTH=835 /DNA_ID=CAMNT_0010821119 /DNA_START=370 /DNA_END=2877 /DNA_ORIENTATION=-